MSNLKTHIRAYHFKRKDFACYYQGCQSAYLHKKSLNEHIARVHRATVSTVDTYNVPLNCKDKNSNHRQDEGYE